MIIKGKGNEDQRKGARDNNGEQPQERVRRRSAAVATYLPPSSLVSLSLELLLGRKEARSPYSQLLPTLS